MSDEFAELERELSGNVIKRGFHDLEDVVIEIEQGNSDFVLTRRERVFTSKMKKSSLAVFIILIPLYGIGLIFLLLGLLTGRWRTLNENTTHIHSRAYVKKHNLIVDYKMKNDIVQKTKSVIIESHSYISKSSNEHLRSNERPRCSYYLKNLSGVSMFLLLYDDMGNFESVENTMREFAKIANLEIK